MATSFILTCSAFCALLALQFGRSLDPPRFLQGKLHFSPDTQFTFHMPREERHFFSSVDSFETETYWIQTTQIFHNEH